MKSVALIAAVGLLTLVAACSHGVIVEAPPPPPPSIDCQLVYHHIVEVSVNEYIGQNLSVAAHQAAMEATDRHYQEEGTAYRFYMFCTRYIDQQQRACALQATNLSAIHLCWAP